MTNERAIELLHRLQDEQFDGIHGDERREALSMAVRALSGDGDTISRKMAIDAVNDCGICLQKIVDLPSAQPERKIGTCDECIHKDRFDYEPPCKMCIRIASKGRDGDYYWKESD